MGWVLAQAIHLRAGLDGPCDPFQIRIICDCISVEVWATPDVHKFFSPAAPSVYSPCQTFHPCNLIIFHTYWLSDAMAIALGGSNMFSAHSL